MNEQTLEPKKPNKKKLISWLIVGIIISLGPAWGVLLTIISMIHSANTLSQTSVDPQVLADKIAISMNATAIGFIMFPIGLIIVIITLIEMNRTK